VTGLREISMFTWRLWRTKTSSRRERLSSLPSSSRKSWCRLNLRPSSHPKCQGRPLRVNPRINPAKWLEVVQILQEVWTNLRHLWNLCCTKIRGSTAMVTPDRDKTQAIYCLATTLENWHSVRQELGSGQRNLGSKRLTDQNKLDRANLVHTTTRTQSILSTTKPRINNTTVLLGAPTLPLWTRHWGVLWVKRTSSSKTQSHQISTSKGRNLSSRSASTSPCLTSSMSD